MKGISPVPELPPQLHGAYEFQAITPNHKDGRTAPDGSIPLDQVIEAKEFVEENQK